MSMISSQTFGIQVTMSITHPVTPCAITTSTVMLVVSMVQSQQVRMRHCAFEFGEGMLYSGHLMWSCFYCLSLYYNLLCFIIALIQY